MSAAEDPLRELWNRIEKLTGVYTQFMVLALAARGQEEWVLLHCSVVLCSTHLPRAPSAPYPEEEFLVAQGAYPISELKVFVSDIETEHKMHIGGDDITICWTGNDSPQWYLLPDDKRDANWADYRGYSIIVRYSTDSMSHVFSLLRSDPQSELRGYYRRPYSSLREFGEAVMGTSLDSSGIVTVDIIAPSRTSVESLNVEETSLEISFRVLIESRTKSRSMLTLFNRPDRWFPCSYPVKV